LLTEMARAKKEKTRAHQAFLRWWTANRRIALRRGLAAAGLLQR
jgi:hypothetical protein